MRFESGEIHLRSDWQTLDDLAGTALGQVQGRLTGYPVEIQLPSDLPALRVDATLITQVFANLLENCARHTPPGTRIRISAAVEQASVRVIIDDDGLGGFGPLVVGPRVGHEQFAAVD